MNKRADDLAERAAASLREISPADKALYGPAIVQMLESAAEKVDDSQVAWRTYRDQYCTAIALGYATGSGAGTAMEVCLYKTASDRVRQLRGDFSSLDKTGPHPR